MYKINMASLGFIGPGGWGGGGGGAGDHIQVSPLGLL